MRERIGRAILRVRDQNGEIVTGVRERMGRRLSEMGGKIGSFFLRI